MTHAASGPPARRSLHEMLARAQDGVLLFGITPPRQSVSADQAAQIAQVTTARLEVLDIDGLVLYDIDDESDRNPQERPFPYLPTKDPAEFYTDHLEVSWDRPTIIYRCVGKYTEAALGDWLRSIDIGRVMTVFVGASSGDKTVHTGLSRAYDLRGEVRPEVRLGGVTITERYTRRRDEHLRMLSKQERGCTFFVTQVVYDVDATKSMLSDYFHACRERGIAPRPVIFTLSVCGSLKTLAFLNWLGVDVPRWLENELRYAEDPLTASYEQCVANAADLIAFCRRLGIPFGFHVESVSIRKVEIDAAVALASQIRKLLNA
ncbi:MAG TPA: hypothetical protein VF062_04545 [Candidatus Limnocylindrales bacterium]